MVVQRTLTGYHKVLNKTDLDGDDSIELLQPQR